MIPPPPPWFSMITLPSCGLTCSAHSRATTSTTPPAERGTPNRPGWSGYRPAPAAHLAELAEIEIVDRAGRCAWLDRVEQEILAGDQVRPNALGLGRRRPDRSGAADAGVIAADHRKNLDPADIAVREHALRRADIG